MGNWPKFVGLTPMSEQSKWLRELSEPWSDGEKVKSAIERAAKLAELPYWRAFDIWYGKEKQIQPFEIEQIAKAIQAKNERDARNEFRDLKARIAKMEARFMAGDQEFYSPSIGHARDLARQLRSMGRPLVGRRGCVA